MGSCCVSSLTLYFDADPVCIGADKPLLDCHLANIKVGVYVAPEYITAIFKTPLFNHAFCASLALLCRLKKEPDKALVHAELL